METGDMSHRVASSYYLDTAKDNSVHIISAQEKNNSSTVKPPPFGIKCLKPQDYNTFNMKNLHPDPFSYPNSTGDNFVSEISGTIVDPTLGFKPFTFPRQTLPKDGEIGVFDADKYFNVKLEHKIEPKTKHDSRDLQNPLLIMANAKPQTPSLCSEASSWNSQTALILDFQRNCSQKPKKAIGRRVFTGFGCRGPCFDKDLVVHNSMRHTRTGSERINIPFDRNNPTANDDHLIKIEPLDESRPSIEVFGSNNASKSSHSIASDMERKLSMLTWDAIPMKGKTVICDDMASEASSDLFEIDALACMSPNSRYAPSEASIQWSVVTASATDYNSVLSDCNINEITSISIDGNLISKNNNASHHKSSKKIGGVQKGLAGGFLGCKSQKAAYVAENNVGPKSCRVEKSKHNREMDVVGKWGRAKGADGRLKLVRPLGSRGLMSMNQNAG